MNISITGCNCLVLPFLFFLLWGFFTFWRGTQERELNAALATSGIGADAQVIQKWQTSGGRSNRAYYHITYQFEANAPDGTIRPYKHQQQVTAQHYTALAQGASVTIKYLRERPHQSARLWGEYADSTKYNLLLLQGGSLIGISFLCLIFTGFLGVGSGRSTPVPRLVIVATLSSTSVDQRFESLRTALNQSLPTWKKDADTASVRRLIPIEANLKVDPSIQEIDYGRCANGGFFLYALLNLPPDKLGGTAFPDAYSYSDRSNCTPSGWEVTTITNYGNNWTLARLHLPTPTPTASAQ